MEIINDCTTVNCGKAVPIKLDNGFTFVELLGPGFSSHLIPIVCWYTVMDGIKTEVALNFDNKGPCIVVYKFRDRRDSQHYWSRAYRLNTLPKKYEEAYRICKTAYDQVYARS